jgi:adenylate kinase family enzyme
MSNSTSTKPHCSTAIILGACPGGGKGTLVTKMREAGYKVCALPFREVLDEMVAEKKEWASVITPARESGVLIPLDVMTVASERAFERFQVDPEEVLMLDGFPRTFGQMSLALNGLKSKRYERNLVLHLECHPVLAAARMMKRARDAADRDPYKIYNRMLEFFAETEPVIKLFKEHQMRLGLEFVHFDSNHLEDTFQLLKLILNL